MSLEAALVENTTALREMQALFAKVLANNVTVTQTVEGSKKSVQAPAPAASQATATATAAPKQTADAPTPAAQAAVAPAPASTAAIEYVAVANAINDMVPKDKPRVVAALAKFGAKKGPDLKPEQYAAFLEELA